MEGVDPADIEYENSGALATAMEFILPDHEATGQLNPYQDGPLGVIVNGAYADLLLVEGNPLDEVTILGNPKKNLKLIMKDGKVYRNTL